MKTRATDREDFNVSADVELHQAVLSARRSGKRYGGKLVSCTMAFELGAKILLGLEENEEDIIRQDIEEIKTQRAALEQKERMRLEQLRMMEASREAKLSDAAEQNNNVQILAHRILEIWDNVTILNKRTMIESLVNIDTTRLDRHKLETVFPRRPTPKPSDDEAVRIAYNLLEGEIVGA